jgi:hypothetical protein
MEPEDLPDDASGEPAAAPCCDEIRTAFTEYKANKDAELAGLEHTLTAQTRRASMALARAEATESEMRDLNARLAKSAVRIDQLQKTAETLAVEVKRANAVNAANKAWLEKMSRDTRATEQRFASVCLVKRYLPNAIENYRNRFKRLPPMSVKELNITSRFKGLRIESNASNECSEALLVALRNPDFPAPLRARYLPTQDPLGNTDADRWSTVPDGGSKIDALEIVDAWGHPVVYIHKNQYTEAVRVVNGKGVAVQVAALLGPDGVFYNPTSYQIFSLGPNGVQEVETKSLKNSDDIRNFELKSG